MSGMPNRPLSDHDVVAENEQLRARLAEAEEALRAIRNGEVDALVVESVEGPKLFTLQGVDAAASRLLGDMLAQVGDAVVATDPGLRVTFVNAAAERQYGIRANEVLGSPIESLLGPDWPTPHAGEALWAAVRSGQEWRGEGVTKAGGGRLLPVESTISALCGANGAFSGYLAAVRDISARKAAEAQVEAAAEALRVVTDRFEAAIHTSPVVVFSQDCELRYTWIHNPALGWAVSEVVGKRDGDLFERAEDAALIEDIKRRVLETGHGVRAEVTVRHEGVDRWFDLSVRPQHDAAGLVMGVTCAAVDITARKHAESDLAFLAELGEAFTAAVSAHEVARTAAETLSRYFRLARCVLVDIDDTQGTATVFHDHSPDDQPSLVGVYRIADYHTAEERQQLRSGRPVVIHDVTDGARSAEAVARFRALHIGAMVDAPYLDSGRLKFVLSVMCTEPHSWREREANLLHEVAARAYLRLERARAEEALRAAHDTFSHLVEQSPFGVYAVDSDFRLVQVSAGAQKVFETVRPLLGRDFAEVMRLLWAEPFATDCIRIFRHTLDTGEPYHAPSSVERRQDIGTVESYDWKTERVILPDGRHGVVCHFYDLSDRQRYEAALRDADRQKDEFLAMLAHELRNPLAPIRTAAAVLRTRGPAERVVVACGDTIDRQTTFMARLLDDLLDVSRLSQGKLTLQRAPVLVDDILEAAAETSRPSLDQQGHILDATIVAPGMLLNGDAARLTQVFANLLNNAAKFSPPATRIEVVARREEDRAVVTVRDAGIGIAPEMLERVFELFTQASHGTDHGAGGLGIGLSLARRLVELHGGSISAASGGVGRGSEFTVSLPLATPDVRIEQVRADPAELPGLERRRVLVVDDNVDAADMTAMLLRTLGCDVQTAYDGETGARAAESFHPDVVLLDLGLPGIDGHEVSRRIRGSAWGQTVRLVAVSGWGREEDRQRSREAGFDGHLTKPVEPEALIRLIRDAPGGG